MLLSRQTCNTCLKIFYARRASILYAAQPLTGHIQRSCCREAIVNWVKKRLVGIELLDSMEDLQRSKERSEVFLMGYFEQDEVRLSIIK